MAVKQKAAVKKTAPAKKPAVKQASAKVSKASAPKATARKTSRSKVAPRDLAQLLHRTGQTVAGYGTTEMAEGLVRLAASENFAA